MKLHSLKKWLCLFLAVVLVAGLVGCFEDKDKEESSSSEESSEEEPAEYPVTVEGVTIRSRPSAVISLSPSLTEKLFDLGLEDCLEGVSDYCDYPAEARSLPACGTALIPNMDAIKDFAPHLVLTQTQMAEDDLIALQQMGADVVVLPPAKTIGQFKETYVSLARMLEGEFSGGRLGEDFAQNLQSRLDYLSGYLVPYAQEHGTKPALYLRLLDFNVATGDTLESQLMEVIGLENIARDQTGWLYPEEAAKGDGRKDFESVEVIFMDESFVNIKMLEQSAFYKGLPATIKDKYLYIDSLVFERQSLRMLDILADMASYAYPDAVPSISGGEDRDLSDEVDEDEDDDEPS